MKKLFILLLCCFLILNFNILAKSNPDLKASEKILNKIIHDLDSIISNSENQNKTVKEHFDFTKNKIFNNELPILVDSTLDYNFRRCALFNMSLDDNKDIDITLGPFLVDKYEDFPTLVYATIINSFQYAYDYYNNKDLFIIGTLNPIEKTYFEMDAIAVEALFLDTYMKENNNLGWVEKYLILDLENNLYGSATLFYKTDLELLHSIDKLSSKEKSSKELLKEFADIGKNLIKEIRFDSESEWDNYCSFITLRTYVYYSEQVIFDIVHLKDGINHDSFNRDDYPDNMKIVNDIRKITADNYEHFSYYERMMKSMDDYYNK